MKAVASPDLRGAVAPTVLAFLGALLLSMSTHDMLHGSDDARSIWATIVSFDTGAVRSSYVLYKGMLSVYPYVWLRRAALDLGLDEFTLIRAYHAALFAWAAAIATPALVARLTGRTLGSPARALVVALLLLVAEPTLVFYALMIDLPSWAFFFGTAWAGLRMLRHTGTRLWAWAAAVGLFAGLAMAGSGQYTLPTSLVLAYLAVLAVQRWRTGQLRFAHAMLALALVAGGIAVPRVVDQHFHATIVQPMRDRGEWLPTGAQWVIGGLSRLMDQYKFGYPDRSNRGLAVLKDTLGDGFAQRHAAIVQGGQAFTVPEYVDIVRRHALDFAVMWTTKAFLAMSYDRGRASASLLLLAYTSLFLCLWLLVRRCRVLRDVVRPEALLVLSVLSTIAAPVVLFIDMRYALSLHALVLGVAVQVATDAAVRRHGRDLVTARGLEGVGMPVPWTLLAYLAFLALCFSFYGALLEIPGSEPSRVLFTW